MKFTTPRLRLTTRSDIGDVSVIAEFADGPRGRKEAEKALSNTDGSVFIEREFSDGATQSLVRIPQNHDGSPLTWEDARHAELDRARLLLSGQSDRVNTPPLTRLEQLAEASATQDYSMGHVRRREAKLTELDAQVDSERSMLWKREALALTATTQRPQDSDLASPEEALSRRSRGRCM